VLRNDQAFDEDDSDDTGNNDKQKSTKAVNWMK